MIMLNAEERHAEALRRVMHDVRGFFMKTIALLALSLAHPEGTADLIVPELGFQEVGPSVCVTQLQAG